MKKSILIASLSVALVLSAATFLTGADHSKAVGERSDRFSKVTGAPVSTMLDINRAAAWYSANGEQERIPSSGNAGLFYPIGTLANAVYSAGIVWSGNFNDGRTPILRTNGQSYNNGTKPGRILGLRTGVAEDANAPDVRLWRIRRDYMTADVSQDAAYLNNVGLNNVSPDMIAAIRAQYAKDWKEWPASKGAPFYDHDSDGVYTPEWNDDGTPKLFPEADEPGIAGGDQVIWYVCNDIGVSEPWSCPETGIEEQATIWGYARTDAIGNVIFKRFRLIYKGIASTPPDATINPMYMCQWSDVDLGDSGDDFAGCDTTLSIGYIYNGGPNDAVYATYGLPPASSGYVFLQGPLVPGAPTDSALFDLHRVYGKKNLPMTSFIYFAAGGRYSDPPFNLQGSIEWNQMLRGLPPQPAGPPDPPPLRDPVTGLPSHFWLSGDPVAHSGWTDGTIDAPGDRRMLLCSGPFTMAVGDTQELVSSWVGGLGSSYLSSVAVMKFNAQSALFAYSTLFNLPKPPSPPSVNVTNLNDEVLLDWETDTTAIKKTEIPVATGGFAFEGYTIYQLLTPSADLSTTNAKRLATFDVTDGVLVILQKQFDPASGLILDLPVQFGNDLGIKRFYRITDDAWRGRPLVNGQPYYFAVTAYSYSPIQNSLGRPTVMLESPPTVYKAVPQIPNPGTRYAYNEGDTVKGFIDVVGKNDAVINPVIFNPTRPHGDMYKLSFFLDAVTGKIAWSLADSTTGATIVSKGTDLTATVEYRVPDAGYSLYVGAPPNAMKSVVDGNGNPAFGPPTGSAAYAVLSSDGALATIAGLGPGAARNYKIVFDGTGSFALSFPPGVGLPKSRHVPFSVWDVGRTSTDVPKQVCAAVNDLDGSTTWNLSTTPIVQGGKTFSVFEPVWITAIPYPTSNDSVLIGQVSPPGLLIAIRLAHNSATDANAAVFGFSIADIGGTGAVPPTGTTFVFNKYLGIQAGDVKVFTPTKADIDNPVAARADVTLIKVFPNPYYGINRAETDRDHKFVTFSHLPDRAIIRIFNLAGVLVRTLRHPDQNPKGAGQFMDWNLQNSNGLPVASGIYIAFIDMVDNNGNSLGTKTVKFAIIQEQQFLRYF